MAAESRPRGLFVTGTDTGVGKTVAGAALALFLRKRGLRVGVMKPVETGVERPEAPGPDAALLRWASGCDAPEEIIAPYRLREPLAPALAAQREKVFIDTSHLLRCAEQLAARSDFLLVEGAGGLMVPLAGGILMADLARQMDLPLLVVARPQLGTINHTLLTVFATRTMGLPLAGFLLNGMPPRPDAAEETAPHTLASLASADLLGVLGRAEGDDREKVEVLAEEIAALPSLPWLLQALKVD